MFDSLKVLAILMISAKLLILGLLKTKSFWNKVYDVLVCLWRKQDNFITGLDGVMWSKFVKSSISMCEVIITSVLKVFDQKNQFFGTVLLVKVQ